MMTDQYPDPSYNDNHQENDSILQRSPIIYQASPIQSELRQFEYIDELIISDHVDNNFKKETQVPLKQFITLLQQLIANQREKEGENELFIYIKENLFIILIESLRICIKKKGKLDLEPFLEEFLEGQKKHLSQSLQYKIFSNPALCKKIRQYVKMEFNNYVPQGAQYVEFFKKCWLDFSHQKQRDIDKIESNREDLTIYNKIYRWDKVYLKIIELIIGSNSLSNLNIKDENQILQSSFIYKNGLQEIRSQIDQMSNKIKIKEIKIQQQQMEQIQHMDIPPFQNMGQMNILQQNLDNNKKSIYFEEQIQNQCQWKKDKQQANNSKLVITDKYMQRKQKVPDILGKLIYKDLKYQIDKGIHLHEDFIEFYEKLDRCFRVEGYQCGKKQIFMLYHTKNGKDHIEKYFQEGYLISQLKSDIDNLQHIKRELIDFIKVVRQNRYVKYQ